MVWHGMVFYGIELHGISWYSKAWYGLVQCGMVRRLGAFRMLHVIWPHTSVKHRVCNPYASTSFLANVFCALAIVFEPS